MRFASILLLIGRARRALSRFAYSSFGAESRWPEPAPPRRHHAVRARCAMHANEQGP